MLRFATVKRFFRLWLILAIAYLVLTLALCWIVSGSIVYPTETFAHVLIVPFVQAALIVLLAKSTEPQA